MIRLSIIIWLVLILIKIYDFFYLTENYTNHTSSKQEMSSSYTENLKKPNFNPEWEGHKVNKNHDKIQLNKNK